MTTVREALRELDEARAQLRAAKWQIAVWCVPITLLAIVAVVAWRIHAPAEAIAWPSILAGMGVIIVLMFATTEFPFRRKTIREKNYAYQDALLRDVDMNPRLRCE